MQTRVPLEKSVPSDGIQKNIAVEVVIAFLQHVKKVSLWPELISNSRMSRKFNSLTNVGTVNFVMSFDSATKEATITLRR